MRLSRQGITRVAVIFGAWGLLAAITLGNSLLSRRAVACDAGAEPSTWSLLGDLARTGLPPYVFWALLTPLIVLLGERLRPERLREPRVLGLHAGIAAVVVGLSASFKTVSHNLLLHVQEMRPTDSWHLSLADVRQALHGSLPVDLLTYGGILALGVAWTYYRSARERETEAARLQTRLAESRFEALRAKVHPHFLFNTLNTISALAERDPGATRETVANLSDLLRRALHHGSVRETPLAEELRFSQQYLDIERRRFGDRLRVEVAVSPRLQQALVPTFLLQPLLENSIRHGLSVRRGPGTIRVVARARGDELLVSVDDDGPGVEDEVREGIGLQSTGARLQELYGDAAGLKADNAPDGGFRVRVRLPLRFAGETEGPEGAPEAERADASGELADAGAAGLPAEA